MPNNHRRSPGPESSDVFSPEEGVMLDADLPQPLGGSVVGELEANGAFKLLVLDGGRGTEQGGVDKSSGISAAH